MNDVLKVALAQARLERRWPSGRDHWYGSSSKDTAAYLLRLTGSDPELAMQLWDAMGVYQEPEWTRDTIQQQRWYIATGIQYVLGLERLPEAYERLR